MSSTARIALRGRVNTALDVGGREVVEIGQRGMRFYTQRVGHPVQVMQAYPLPPALNVRDRGPRQPDAFAQGTLAHQSKSALMTPETTGTGIWILQLTINVSSLKTPAA